MTTIDPDQPFIYDDVIFPSPREDAAEITVGALKGAHARLQAIIDCRAASPRWADYYRGVLSCLPAID